MFNRGPEPDRTLQRKTNDLVQEYIGSGAIEPVRDIFAIDEQTLEVIGSRNRGDNTRVINLIKSIEKIAEEQSEDPYLEFVNWRQSEKELRELRKKITFAIYAEVDDLDRVTSLVDSLFDVLMKMGTPHAEAHQ